MIYFVMRPSITSPTNDPEAPALMFSPQGNRVFLGGYWTSSPITPEQVYALIAPIFGASAAPGFDGTPTSAENEQRMVLKVKDAGDEATCPGDFEVIMPVQGVSHIRTLSTSDLSAATGLDCRMADDGRRHFDEQPGRTRYLTLEASWFVSPATITE